MNKKLSKKMVITIAAVFAVIVVVGASIILPKLAKAQKVNKQLDLGEKYIDELNYEQAIVSYLEVIEIDPKNKDAYGALVDIYVEIGEYDKAEEILNKAEEELGNEFEDESLVMRDEIEKARKNAETVATPTLTHTPTPTPSNTPSPTVTPMPTPTPTNTPSPTPEYTFAELNKTMYVKSGVNVRDLPSTKGNKIGSLKKNEEIEVTGRCNETGWYRFVFKGQTAYVSGNYVLAEATPTPTPTNTPTPTPTPTVIPFPDSTPVPTSVPVAFTLPENDSQKVILVQVPKDSSAIEVSLFSESGSFDSCVSYYVGYYQENGEVVSIGNVGVSLYASDAFNKNNTTSFFAEKAGQYGIFINNAVYYNSYYYSGTNINEIKASYRVILPDENEPNASVETATEIKEDSFAFFNLLGNADTDYFVINLTEDYEKLEIAIGSKTGSFDAALVYNVSKYNEETGNLDSVGAVWGMYAMNAIRRDTTKQFTIAGAGTYYIKVTNASNANSLYYSGDNESFLYIKCKGINEQ